MPEGNTDSIDNEEWEKFLENANLQLPSGSFKFSVSTSFFPDKECTEK